MKKYFLFLILATAVWLYNIKTTDEVVVFDLPPAQDFDTFEKTTMPSVEEDFVVEDSETTTSIDLVLDTTSTVVLGEQITESEVEDITSINLSIPFTSQAPTANWDQPWQDACEEASVLMVDYYYNNKNLPNKISVEQTLFDMVAWQEKNWQSHSNLPVAKLAEYVEENFNYQAEIIENLTVEKIEEYLSQGLPVIVPANGKILDNPYFSHGGPEYHMLVIKGFLHDEQKFITNDPGTRRGEDFIYSYENMMSSIADWDTKKSAASGPKRALILYKN